MLDSNSDNRDSVKIWIIRHCVKFHSFKRTSKNKFEYLVS